MAAQQKNDEATLVLAGRKGDKEALCLLLMENWSWLKMIIYNIIGKFGKIDDVLQNIYLRIILETKKEKGT